MEELERLKGRLDNIRAVEPILSALRTISSGSRVLALKKSGSVDAYRQDMLHILALVVPHLSRSQRIQSAARRNRELALLVIGSERGLCGAFNEAVVGRAEQALQEHSAAGTKVMLMTLGTRVQRALQRRDHAPAWSRRLSVTALPPYELARELISEWLRGYESHRLDAVDVIYNAYRGLSPYEPTQVRLLPPELPPLAAAEGEWPAVIETDPRGLYVHALELWLSTRLYGILLESAAAEHTARYQLLDGAAENAERLMEELELFLQVARQEAITSEMRDLASGAGLLGAPTE